MDETAFANALAVADYLKMRGWRIKKSAVYTHIKQGKLRPDEDGTFRVKVVDKYAKTFLKRLDDQEMSAGLGKLQERRLKADTEKLEAQAEHWRNRAKVSSGLYVEKATFEMELAGRAAIFQQGLNTFIMQQTPDLIKKANGDQKLVPEVMQFLTEQIEVWLATYSEPMEFEVVIDAEVAEKSEDVAYLEEEPGEDAE